jgi:tungstate transport system ATP-binding protein
LRVDICCLEKRYDNKTVLDIEHLHFEPGLVHTVLGPNGSGKSTLLSIIAGLEEQDKGVVRYGTEAKGFAEIRDRVTLVMQQPYLFNTTVFANIASGLRYRGTGRKEIEQRVIKEAEKVNVIPFLRRNAYMLSGGEKQRVALARALVLEPELLLLDEATANLDPESVGIIETVLKTYCRDTGATIIMVTHNIFQATRMADRVYLLMGGKVIECGDKKEFFENTRSSVAKEFLGGELVY